MHPLSVVVITYNEEKNIRRCIESVSKIADEVIVVDSFSEDETVAIALSLGAIVKQSKFDGYIAQKNKAITMASNDHVLLLDADEFLSNELSNSILKEKENFSSKAYSMKRCSIFCGSYIKHGLWYPDKKLRLFNKNYGICGGFNPHDKVIMQQNIKPKLLKGDLMHHTFSSVREYQQRNDVLSTIAARSLYDAGNRKYRLKIIFSPLWAFINGYFFRMGFLEGREGFIIATLCANQSYLKYYKLRLLQQMEITNIAWNNTNNN